MIKYFTVFIIILTLIQSCSQVEKKQDNTSTTEYRLFRTNNMWTFLKLNTRNGKLWQVQFDIKGDNRFISDLSSVSLVKEGKESNDRFTLYPTENMFTYILLDQIDGRTWQVQWSMEPENRGIISIE